MQKYLFMVHNVNVSKQNIYIFKYILLEPQGVLNLCILNDGTHGLTMHCSPYIISTVGKYASSPSTNPPFFFYR